MRAIARRVTNWANKGAKRGAAGALAALLIPLFSPALAEEPVVQGPYLVLDAGSGQVYEHHDAMRPWYPASTTKIMTAFVAFRAIEAGELTLRSPVVISARALKEPPSKMGFKVGTVLTLDNALKIMMVKSANDISVAIAEAVGGSVEGFAKRMNAESGRLGMTRSHWVNPNGLPDTRQVTSAKDMAILARAVLSEFPQYRGYMALPGFRLGGAVTPNYNLLIDRYPGATGMKTGFICASGFNLVASAKRGNREVIAVIFGAFTGLDRAERAVELLDEGFSRGGGGFFSKKGPSLASVSSGSGYPEPFDMRPVVCGGKKPQTPTEAAEPTFKALPDGTIVIANPDGTTRPSRLGPKLGLLPVEIALGGAEGVTGSVVATVPLPRPRPDVGTVELAGTLPPEPPPEEAAITPASAEPVAASAAEGLPKPKKKRAKK